MAEIKNQDSMCFQEIVYWSDGSEDYHLQRKVDCT